jgi:hypothetical protein
MSEAFGASVLQLKETYMGNMQTRMQQYGTAVTVGVFIGAALTTGICAGIAGWWAANQSSIFLFLNTATRTVVTAATNATTGTTTGTSITGAPLKNEDEPPLRAGTIVARSTYLTVQEQQALHHAVLTVDELKQRVVALEARLRKAHVGPGSNTEVVL